MGKKKGKRRRGRAKLPLVRTLGALAGLSYFMDLRGIPLVGNSLAEVRSAVESSVPGGSRAANSLIAVVGTQVLGRELSKMGYNPAFGPVRLF